MSDSSEERLARRDFKWKYTLLQFDANTTAAALFLSPGNQVRNGRLRALLA
jgi:hypothetical protein